MSKEITTTPNEDSLPRKVYAAPRLVIYGNISRMTQSVGKNGAIADSGGKGNMDKTS
jgi:hypothetical protein